jgi:CIC family chloride channel protein
MQNVREIVLESAELADLVVADEISTKDVVTVTAKSNLNEAMEQFALIDIEQLPVVDEHDDKKIVGMLSRMDVMAAYNKEVLKKSDTE